ncbi:RNA pyrophosphohydrolase [Acetobacter farinalis]|uniref:RNA pyrophosphohydrolase n=1 Tax=Acetobacter farinalis TaxID=1260984 RepID=A0ABT3Q4B4_9PROT|nr:RNA pyrophosphohydrolase [Acetobacter farinalis]MCX2560140.1 RNA pyrophosphohydrolase [Acetobacter farinalis]NHO28795.1 RNA pyrophosphohydrolase [Acetobacter farinalis]
MSTSHAAEALPYRPNVAAMIFRKDGRILIARRMDQPGAGGPLSEGVWQCPQGGIDEGEDPKTAVFREVQEELGLDASLLHLLQEHPDWITYDLPEHLIGKALGGRFRGQTQKWFALAFNGTDADIRLDAHTPAEFDAFQWINLADLPFGNVGFKKPIYERLVQDFGALATPA